MELTDKLIECCVKEGTADPVENFKKMTSVPDVPMHGPIHHIIVPMAIITALWNTGKDFDLEPMLRDAAERMSPVPGAICGNLGVCGSAIGAGASSCLINKTSPMTQGKKWSNNIALTAEALKDISEVDGPRCCKRDSVLAIMAACRMSDETYGKHLECSDYVCGRMKDNQTCIGKKCPFSPAHKG